MASVNGPSWGAVPVAFTSTDRRGGASGLTVTTPSRLPLKGTCCWASAGPESPNTARTASARLAAELWRFMLSLHLVCDTLEGHRCRRADRAPGRCRAGEALAWPYGPHRPLC